MKKEKIEKNWITTDKRFVVFLDIMGFKDFVSRNTHEYVYDMMNKLSKNKEIIDTVLDGDVEDKYLGNDLYTTSFSDSMILFSKNDSPISLEIITVSASFLIAEAMKVSIPMKGAISHGQISVNKKQQIYFGQPLIDAYLLQEEVNYYGIVCHNSVDHFLHNLSSENDYLREEFFEIKTPLKSGAITHKNINWFSNLKEIDENSSYIKTNFDNVIVKLKSMTSGAPRKYIDNTIEVFNLINKN